MLGESPGCDLDDPLPSRAGMKTVLDVLGIQKNFWPVLESSFSKLQSQWEIYATKRSKDSLSLWRACVCGGRLLVYMGLTRLQVEIENLSDWM